VATQFFQSFSRAHLAVLGAGLGLITLASCGETTVSAPLPAARVEVVPGPVLSGGAGQVLPDPIEVRVFGSDNQTLPGVAVTFSAATGGSVDPATATTDGDGLARTRWTLGQTAGPNILTVTASGGVSATITATVSAGPPAAVTAVAGNNQTAAAGATVAIAPSVRVVDAFGNLVSSAAVTFTVLSGGGQVTNGLTVTNAQGIAAVGSWRLGPSSGTQTLAARVEANGVTNNPIVFSATAQAGPPVSMVAVSLTAQVAPAGSNVGDPPSVIVRDAAGIGVSGLAVTFTVTAGGGSVVGSPATTNASGIATLTSWRLGPASGLNTVTATAAGLPTVTFNATGSAGSPATVVAQAGNNQVALQGTAVPLAPTVKVTDASGNPVSGATVTFSVLTGGGSASGLNQLTDALGLASVGSWTLGPTAPNTLVATVAGAGISGNPVTFTAQSATQIGLTSAPAGPIALGSNFTITVQLQNSAGASVALSGRPLAISIASGGGTLNGTVILFTDGGGAVSFTGLNVTGAAGARTFTISGGAGLAPVTTGSITFN
jgi:adhesin/invasin